MRDVDIRLIGLVVTLVKASALVLMLHAGLCVAADTQPPADPHQGYRFVIKADGGRRIAIRGLITVDGKDRLIEREETPFEFRCEGGTVVSGYFEVLEAGRSLRLSVFDPVYSERRSALSAEGFDHIRFSWAQPGVGPRCADAGQGACPSSTPSVEEFRKRLESMREAGAAPTTDEFVALDRPAAANLLAHALRPSTPRVARLLGGAQ